jgi:hypothetical protein
MIDHARYNDLMVFGLRKVIGDTVIETLARADRPLFLSQ